MDRQDHIQELITTLNNINYQLAELARIKETLEPQLAELLDHSDDGQKTYTAGKYKVTCRSGFIYTLNKDEYAVLGGRLPECFRFVRQRIAYDIDKNVLRDAEKYASAEEMELIASMVSKKPSKLAIKITAGV